MTTTTTTTPVGYADASIERVTGENAIDYARSWSPTATATR
jgi:hypothetical protein